MGIKVAITDDHNLVVNGIQNILKEDSDLEVCGSYNTGNELLEGLKHNQPDILLLDIQLPDKQGNELVRIIAKNYPKIKVLALTSMDSLFYVKDMMKHGCMGFLSKHTDKNTLLKAIRQIHAGEQFLEPHLKEQWMQSLIKVNKQSTKLPTLTQREKEVLKLVAMDYTNREIADKLFISQRTVESHRYSLLQKLDVKSTAGLVKIAIQMELIEH